MSDPSIVKTLGPEAYRTALIFWLDFEKSAISLPAEKRQKFVSLSSDILVLGREFLKEANAARPPTAIKPAELTGLKDKGMGVRLQLQAHFTQRDLLVYPGSLQAQMIMRSAPSEEPRRRVYIAANSSTPEQIHILEKLLKTRGELARLVGRESYADMTLADKMAKSPGQPIQMLSVIPILIVPRERTLFPRRTYRPYPTVRSEGTAHTKYAEASASWGYLSPYYPGMGS